jgi:hypothetical protein
LTEQIIMCVECLRIIVEDHHDPILLPRFGHVGSNTIHNTAYKMDWGNFVVNGTHYCALHALPAYNAQPKFIIEESA